MGRKAFCKCIQASMLQHNQIILREHSQTLREHLRNTQGTLRARSEKHSDNAHNTQRTLKAHLEPAQRTLKEYSGNTESTLEETLREHQGTLREDSENTKSTHAEHQRLQDAIFDIGGGVVLHAHLPLIKYKYL